MPAEIYTYGTQFWMIITSEGLVSITMAMAYLPVFYKLQITTSYEVSCSLYCIEYETTLKSLSVLCDELITNLI